MRSTRVFRAAGITLAVTLLCRSQNMDGLADNGRQAASQNSACLVCHANYRVEPLALHHAQADVGCADCHGSSIEHCGNEENIIAPEIMYPKSKINSSCRKCHATHKTPLTGDTSKVCTDCHGKHRLPFRTKVWDKATGRLLKSMQPTSNRRSAPWVAHTHIAWNITEGPLMEKMTNLRNARYQGYYSVEHHTGKDEYAEVGIQIARVRAVLQSWRSGGTGTLLTPQSRPPAARE